MGVPLSIAATVAALVLLLLALAQTSGAATRRTPTLAPANTVIDGPSASIEGLSGLAVARDGTGGLVYLKDVGGAAHVFVSELLGGSFRAPVQVDAGLGGSSSQPVIAATNGGLMLVAFINGSQLYAVQQPNALTAWQAPVALFSGAANPSLSISPFGKAYLAFTAVGAGGHDVRTAYFNQGQWALGSSPLDANPADDAGTGSGRPQVATAGDGTAIVAWGEGGHIYTRRVLGTSPSIVDEQADPPSVAGWNEVSANDPQVSTGGNSSYASVAFTEQVSLGGTQQTRVLVNRLVASEYTGAGAGDGLTTPGSEDAGQPRVAVQEYGAGFVTSEHSQSHNLFAMTVSNNDGLGGVGQLNSLTEQSDPDAVPATAGTISTLIAWQQDPGVAGLPEIRVRYAANGSQLGPEEVVSSPAQGPTDADQGLAAGGDLAGDAAIAWVQGTGSQTQIVAGQLFQAPGSPSPSTLFRYATSPEPILSWSPASELWGPPGYVVNVDGAVIANTAATQVRSPVALAQGRHSWQVTAVNMAGLTRVSQAATVFVDSLAPRLSLRISGPRHVGARIKIAVDYSDTHPGVPRSAASGVSFVQVRWGDGSKPDPRENENKNHSHSLLHPKIIHRAFHVYKRRGTYRVTVTVKDRAGNKTVKTQRVRITVVTKHVKPRRGHGR